MIRSLHRNVDFSARVRSKEMEISQLSFVLLTVYSVCFGALLGVMYDVIRIPRVLLGAERDGNGKNYRKIELPIIKRKAYPEKTNKLSNALLNVWIAVGDVIFAASCGIMAVMIAYAYNSGRVRAVIFIGLALGFLVYYFTLGKLMMKISELLAFLVRSAAVYVYELIRCIFGHLKKIKIPKIKKKGAKNDIRQNRKVKKKIVSR